MHAVYRTGSEAPDGNAIFHASFPETPASERPPETIPAAVSNGFAARGGPNWAAILAVALFHAILLAALIKLDIIALPKPKAAPLVIELIAEPPAPPPNVAPPPPPEPARPLTPRIVAPPPVIALAVAPPPVQVTNTPPPPAAVLIAPAAKPSPPGPVASADLASTVIFKAPIRFPIESRRRKEGGTVSIRVLIGTDGRIIDASLAHSCGFDRVDKAVLEAIWKWRWSPVVRGGQAMQQKGVFDVTVNPPSA